MILGKDTQQIREQLDNIGKQLAKLSELDKLAHVEKRLELFEKQLAQLTAKFSEELSKITEELSLIKTAREDIQKSARSFNETKQSIEKFAHEKFGDIIKESISQIKIDTDQYKQVKSEINTAVAHLALLNGEVIKLKSISEQVKQADFELSRYAREVTKADAEKLALMKENDNLKTIIAKMRRSDKPQMPLY